MHHSSNSSKNSAPRDRTAASPTGPDAAALPAQSPMPAASEVDSQARDATELSIVELERRIAPGGWGTSGWDKWGEYYERPKKLDN